MKNHNKIYEDEKSIVHIGDEGIFGFIIKDEPCATCNSSIVYYHDYDAKFCPNCNKWLEKGCDDETCIYCVRRPEKPLIEKYTLRSLLNLIDNYLTDSISYDQFYSDFNDFFDDESPDNICKEDYFEEINERLMFAGENPPEEDRVYGYINAEELREWLKDYKEKNLALWKSIK